SQPLLQGSSPRLGCFGEYRGSRRQFWSDLLAAKPELPALLLGTLQSPLGHDTHAATPASPYLLTDVEGVGGLLLTQMQVEDIRRLRIMPEPQGHSQDDASSQLGRKQTEVDVTHCSSCAGPRAAVFRWEQKACFSSFCKILFTPFTHKSVLPNHCSTPATCFVPHTTRATQSSLLCEKNRHSGDVQSPFQFLQMISFLKAILLLN
uniref:Uncharacterized protein n=1 Tax=Strigops habroptila TaxID=2489341 RepID=A0A672TPG7_STRHB